MWLAFLALACVEVVGHYVIEARVVDDADWHHAAARVRAERRDGDLIIAAPAWADPILRRELGDVISLEDAGRSDLAQYRRLWVLSIRGHRPAEAPDARPDFDEQIGAVRVLRWPLPGDGVLYDFTEHVADARVTMRQGSTDTPCRWQSGGRPSGGGLGAGPITPAARHVCDPRRPWLWVGATVQDDLDLAPRYCIWQHPAGREPIRATFPRVPIGARLVLYGDVYYEHERHEEHGPVEVAVFVGDEEIGRMTHRDGDGWKRMVAATRVSGAPAHADVTIEVTAADPNLRTFCWAATTRAPEARR